MTTNRLGELLDMLEHQATRTQTRLATAQARIRELEARNRLLEQRLSDIADTAIHSSRTAPPPRSEAAAPPASADTRASSTKAFVDRADTSTPATAGSPATDTAAGIDHEHDERFDAVADSASAVTTSTGQPPAAESASDEDSAAAATDNATPSPQALLKQWYQRYPQTFLKGHTRPLQIGIHRELARREPWPEKLIRRALASYVNLPRYLKSVRSGISRVDLDGDDAGQVSEQDARHAAQQLEALQQKQQARETEARSRRMAQKLSALTARHER